MKSRKQLITAALVDGDATSRQHIRQLLDEDGRFRVTGEAGTLVRAEQMLRSAQPDVVFLDVQFPDGDGFDLLARLGPRYLGQTIFVATDARHAARAFDAGVIDYVVKPLQPARFSQALERLRRCQENEAVAPSATPQRIAVNAGDGCLRLIATGRIDWIEAAGNYVRVHAGELAETFRDTLNSVERRLNGDVFVRVHRSFIANVDRIKFLEPNAYGDYVITLQDGKQLPLSRRYSERIVLLLGHL